MTDLGASNDALQAEVTELLTLGQSLVEFAPDLAPILAGWRGRLDEAWNAGGPPFALELQLEWSAQALRRHWLQFSAIAPSAAYRSPTEDQQKGMVKDPRLEAFGYERDLHPDRLEKRCATFFPDPPPPWHAQHLLFSSGQAAMTVALLLLQQRLRPHRFTVAHLGKYFETRGLLESLPAVVRILNPAHALDANCLIVEPVACDGHFARVDLAELAARLAGGPGRTRAVIVDSTLVGRGDGMNQLLLQPRTAPPPIIMRVCSGLKLFQQGLEIANVGVLTWFERNDSQDRSKSAVEALRVLRTLTGGGLRSADALALEAPWIFDHEWVARYERAIFAHNAALAAAIHDGGPLFEPSTNSALLGADAPYCVFRLLDPSSESYRALDDRIVAEAKRRNVNLDKGGSFGFRGHRFEIVRPDSGEQPFLRIAMGRRGGWSNDGVIDLMASIASGHGQAYQSTGADEP